MAMKKPKAEEPKKGAPEWMITFSDMMSLLLCFFVLIFAMSTIEEKKFIQVAGSFRDAFGGLIAPESIPNILDQKTRPEVSKEAQRQKKKAYGKDEVLTRLKQKFRSLNLDDIITVKGTEKGIQFTIVGDSLFDRNSAVIKPEAYESLQYLAETLREIPENPIKCTGHTDTGPPPPRHLYEDKWQLSMARARAVMMYLRDYEVLESRMSYEGYADTLPATDERGNPIPGDTEQGWAQHRRVEITLLQTEENAPWYMIDREETPTPTPVIEPEPI